MAILWPTEKFRPVTSHVGLDPAGRRRGRSPPSSAAFSPQCRRVHTERMETDAEESTFQYELIRYMNEE